jgi:hypothetical protein
MTAVRDLLTRGLKNPRVLEDYNCRRHEYPKLAELVPQTLEDVITDRPPWFCHGLAWRMATWKRENIFARLNALLCLVQEAPGWEKEWQNWATEKLAYYDHFFQLLWMLQCFEFFNQAGAKVEFSTEKQAAPDLKIISGERSGDALYAEC